MADDDDTFETLWREHHLDQFNAAIAYDETLTARTAGALDASALHAASFTAPPLPEISLDLAGTATGSIPPPSAGAHPHDLVVIGALGEGGMGKVLLARQRSLTREVAVKVLKSVAADHDGALSLLREAVVMGGIEHPNIVPVHALGRDDQGRPVLVMKRVEGTSWRALLRDPDHPLWTPLLEAHGDRATANLEVLMRVADAAHFAHSRGVIHRDIKPENVMVGAFGEVYLVDWGIAVRVGRDRASGAGPRIRGTPTLMAPEMIDGDPTHIDARTDVYLLGATLHEALTGTARHHGPNLHAVLYSSYCSRPVEYPPDVPEELAALCNEATSQDPARRPQSAHEFRRRLAEHIRHRASLTLSAAASRRLDELSAATEHTATDQSARVYRLATECRFGFTQALEVWPGNARARAGVERALRLLLDHELSHENLDAARALVDELGDHDQPTVARIDALAETLRMRREREAQALREAHETDLTQGVNARLPMFGIALTASATTHLLYQSVGMSVGELTVAHLAFVNAVMLLVLGAGLFVGRRELLVNRVSRQISAYVGLCALGTLTHRLAMVATHQTSIPAMVTTDLMILSALSALASASIRPWIGWMALWSALFSVATPLAPERALAIYSVGITGMLLIGLYFGWARARPSEKT